MKNTINNYSIPPISDDHLSLWLQNSPIFSMASSEDTIFGKHASGSLELQPKERDARMENREGGAKQNPERKQQKRKPSTEAHNLSMRLRRQKFTEKLKALQEIIPNSNKMDKASTLDEAIKYIKTLQYQVQMMSAGYSTFQSSIMMMMSQLGQQGIPSQSRAPFLQTGLPPGGNTAMKYGIETGMSSKFSPFHFPMSQFGLPNACLLPPSTAAAQSLRYPANFLGPLYATSHPYVRAQSNKQGETSPSRDAKNA